MQAPCQWYWEYVDTKKHRKPGWFKYTFIPPESVSERVVELAKRPRRSVTLPGWFSVLAFFELVTPGLVDWFTKILYTKRIKRLE